MSNRTVLEGFARLLPRTFRERVFDPALADLVLTHRAEQARRPGALAQLALVACCTWVLVSQIAWRQITPRRPVRLVRTVALAVLLASYLIFRTRYGHAGSR